MYRWYRARILSCRHPQKMGIAAMSVQEGKALSTGPSDRSPDVVKQGQQGRGAEADRTRRPHVLGG